MSATALVRSPNRSNALQLDHKHKIRFQDIEQMKGQNIKKKINEGDSTWCLKLTEKKTMLFLYRAKEAEKLIG